MPPPSPTCPHGGAPGEDVNPFLSPLLSQSPCVCILCAAPVRPHTSCAFTKVTRCLRGVVQPAQRKSICCVPCDLARLSPRVAALSRSFVAFLSLLILRASVTVSMRVWRRRRGIARQRAFISASEKHSEMLCARSSVLRPSLPPLPPHTRVRRCTRTSAHTRLSFHCTVYVCMCAVLSLLFLSPFSSSFRASLFEDSAASCFYLPSFTQHTPPLPL